MSPELPRWVTIRNSKYLTDTNFERSVVLDSKSPITPDSTPSPSIDPTTKKASFKEAIQPKDIEGKGEQNHLALITSLNSLLLPSSLIITSLLCSKQFNASTFGFHPPLILNPCIVKLVHFY